MSKVSRIIVPLATLIFGYYLGIHHSRFVNKDRVENYSRRHDPLRYISYQTLIMEYSDDKCGEWGGNTETIKINRLDYNKALIAEYLYEKKDCKDPYNRKQESVIKERLTRVLDNRAEHLVVSLIRELIEKKLSSEVEPAHGGTRNSIIIDDSTLLIDDYPSGYLVNFEKLKSLIVSE